MKSELRIETKGKQEDERADEPVTPTGQYFNSKVLSVSILAVLESEVPIIDDDSFIIPQLRDVFLPINPKFSSIMITDKEGVRKWQRAEVNLEDHVKVPILPEGLSTESHDHYFDEYLSKISNEPLPQERPLWAIHIFKYPTTKAAGHVIFKFHHALGDGYSLMGALLSCVQRADNPSLPVTFPSTHSTSKYAENNNDDSNGNTSWGVVSWVPRAVSAMVRTVCDFVWSLLKITCIADDTTPIRSGKDGMSLRPVKITTIELPLHQIKHIKTKLGTTINDILTGMILLGVRLYMREIDKKSSNSQSTALVLFNTRNINGYKSVDEMNEAHSKIWGNQFAFLHVPIPKLVDDEQSSPTDFIYQVRKTIMRLKNSPVTYLTGQYLEIVRRCRGSETVAKLIYSTMNKSSVGVTNMIGPIEQVTLAKHKLKGIYFMVCGTPESLVVTIMSYMGAIRIGVGVKKGSIDSRKLTSCIENAFQLTLDEATKKSK